MKVHRQLNSKGNLLQIQGSNFLGFDKIKYENNTFRQLHIYPLFLKSLYFQNLYHDKNINKNLY